MLLDIKIKDKWLTKAGGKLRTALPKLPISPPKPRIPGGLKPLGGGTGESNPPITPRNSQKGIKQQVQINIPGVKTR